METSALENLEEEIPMCRWCLREFEDRGHGQFFIADGRAHWTFRSDGAELRPIPVLENENQIEEQ